MNCSKRIRTAGTLAGLAFALILTASTALAEDLGRMRVQRMDGSWIVGQVEETPDAYRITVRKGITITLPKSEVKAVLPVEEEAESEAETDSGEDTSGARPAVPDREIEALLEGIDYEVASENDTYAQAMEELPVNEESLKEMLFQAGKGAKVLTTPHVVMVYTGKESEAKRLARRLEAVWRWNVKFFRIINVPIQVPEYKLEVFFFGTNKEFETHSINTSGRPSGALGYFQPYSNRSHFFDMTTFPLAERVLKRAEQPGVPARERRRLKNMVKRWCEFHNMEVVQHEIGHHIHFNLGLYPRDVFLDEDAPDQFPRWLVEGTTMMFEVPPSSAGASLGVINHARLNEFRKREQQFKFTPDTLKRFIVDNMFWFSGYWYPEGWALVYYLRKNFKEGFAKYQQIMSERDPGERVDYNQREKEFEECFGKIDEEWVEKFYEYMDSLHLKKSLLPVDLKP